MDKSKLIESLKWKAEMFAHETDVIEEERKEGGIGNRYLSGQSVAYTEAFEYLEGLAEDIENGEYDKTGHWVRISPAKIYECSECGQTVMTDDIECYHYCHGCGAKMEDR